jgi:hypothetical protein
MVYNAEQLLEGLFRPGELPTVRNIGVGDLPADWQYVWEERAAIMEYDGGLSKKHAEAAALVDTLVVMRRAGNDLP